MKKKLSLPIQILIALVAGVVIGLICSFIPGGPDFTANYLKPFEGPFRFRLHKRQSYI